MAAIQEMWQVFKRLLSGLTTQLPLCGVRPAGSNISRADNGGQASSSPLSLASQHELRGPFPSRRNQLARDFTEATLAPAAISRIKGPINLKRTILISIVDDDESVREATQGLMRSLGYSAITFGSVEDFLNSAQRRDTSCIIADVQMPGTGGIELQSRLIAESDRIPMIFITAFPEERVRAKALEAGAVGFLSKPFDEAHLLTCLESALGNPSVASTRVRSPR